MAQAVGFPKLLRRTPNPGEIFAAEVKGRVVYCLQGEHKPVFLVGHGGPPKESGGEGGLRAVFPGPAHLRPLRDRPLELVWSAPAEAGDLVLTEKGVMLKVHAIQSHHDASPPYILIDIETGKVASAAPAPFVRGWELVCFPLPGRPMVLATFDPLAHSKARGSGS